MNINKDVTIVLKPQEINLVVTALTKLPYEAVFSILASIQKQLTEQFPEESLED